MVFLPAAAAAVVAAVQDILPLIAGAEVVVEPDWAKKGSGEISSI